MAHRGPPVPPKNRKGPPPVPKKQGVPSQKRVSSPEAITVDHAAPAEILSDKVVQTGAPPLPSHELMLDEEETAPLLKPKSSQKGAADHKQKSSRGGLPPRKHALSRKSRMQASFRRAPPLLGMPSMRGLSTRKGVPTKIQIDMMPSGFSKANADQLGYKDWTHRVDGSVSNVMDLLDEDSEDIKVCPNQIHPLKMCNKRTNVTESKPHVQNELNYQAKWAQYKHTKQKQKHK